MPLPFVDMLHRDQYALKCALGDTKKILPLLKERGQTHFAVADYGEISNWVEQLFTCKNSGIVPILGMEIYVNNYRIRDTAAQIEDTQVEDLSTGVISRLGSMSLVERDLITQDYPIAIYARTVEGYYNIIQCHNDAQLNGVDKRPRTSDAFLKEHGKGVVAVLPTPYSEVSSLVCNGLWREAIQQYRLYESVFDRVFMAVTLVEKPEYREINDEVIRFCRHYDLPFIPVLNSHYISPDDHEAFLTVRELARLRGGISYEIEACPGMWYRDSEGVDSLYESTFKSETFTPETYREARKTLDELVGSFSLLDLDYDLKLPRFPDAEKRLREKAWAGFLKKGYDKRGKEYLDRFNYEIDNIVGAGFADYFLVLEEVYSWYGQSHITPLGRGSAAGSLVLNCIGGTGLDPIEHHLLFERFLDAERFRMIVEKGGKVSGGDCPDVDTDVATPEKDNVKRHFAEKYGETATASIGTIGMMKTKSALKDLARLYQVPPEEINQVTTEGMRGYWDEDDEVSIEQLRRDYPALDRLLQKYPKMADTFEKLHGSITSWGVHAGGVLVTDMDLTKNLPLRRGKDGQLVTCWQEGINSRELGMMGFIKFDILAIDQLNVIEHILRLIEERTGKRIDVGDIPVNDREALKQMSEGDTLCIFQFDTELAGKVAARMNGIRCFEDLGSLSTLMRPAALSNHFDVEFGKRRDSTEGIYIPECLKPFLADTYGLPIYQEHIMQAAMALAGFDKPKAYKFMKLIYKGKLHTEEEKEQWRREFVQGAQPLVKRGEVPPDYPNTFYDQILKFLGYGFCKSHAYSYAKYSAVELWLKRYYPLEFLCANLSVTGRSSEKKGNSLMKQRVGYALSRGITVYAPDVRYSGYQWTIHRGGLMAPLVNINGFGAADTALVIKSRPYDTVTSFMDKTGLTASRFDSLLFAGALDCFGDRVYLYNWYHEYYAKQKKRPADRKPQLTFEFDDFGEEASFPMKTRFSRAELDAMFEEMNGFMLHESLRAKYAGLLSTDSSVKTIVEANTRHVNKHFTLLCKIADVTPFTAKKTGTQYMRLELVDGSDSADTVMGAMQHAQHSKTLKKGNVLLLPCELADEGFYIDDLERRPPRVLEG